MRINLLKIILAACLCFSGLQNVRAATKYSDTLKTKRTSYAMPVQTKDTGNYGLHMQMSRDAQNYAQTGIYFYANASDKYRDSEDAIVVNGGTPLVYISSFTSDNVPVCINTLADYAKGKRIRLYENAVYNGAYTLSLADIFGMDTAAYNVFLIDNEKQDSVDIVHTKSYAFNVSVSDTGSWGAYRFVVAIEHKPVGAYKLSSFSGQKVSAGVQLDWQAVNAGNYTGYTLQKLNTTGGYDSLYAVQSDSSITAYNFTDTHPIIGNNVYRLMQNGISGNITYSGTITIGYGSSTPNGAMNLYPNPAKTTMTVSMASNTTSASTYVADIYDLSGARVDHQVATSSSWTNDVSSYKNGLYIIQVKDTNGNLLGQSKFMKVN